MNNAILKEMEILWSSFEKFDVDQKLEAFQRLKESATKEDLPVLLDFLRSERNDFWIRELLAEPICDLGGSQCLPELFDAYDLNEEDGHDNDGFNAYLIDLAFSEPENCKAKLLELLSHQNFKHKDIAIWLIGYCDEYENKK